jgi:hypothetical protein
MISPRAVANQGFGYGNLFVAANGLLPLYILPPNHVGPRTEHRIRVLSRRRDEDEELLLLIFVALQVIDP